MAKDIGMADKPKKNWLTVQFELMGNDLAQAEFVLGTQGALSISLKDADDQPILEPLPGETPIWQRVIINALFPAETDPALIQKALREEMETELLGWRYKNLEDQVWERVWMDDFKPMRFGKNLWIVPSWSDPPELNAINLMLDPGLAFGTGTHPTTRLCLEWLDQHPPQGLDVIDYGCGSGILAIAAVKLGASTAYGVDIDPQAILSSRDNAQRNGISNEQFILTTSESLPVVDMLLANILSGPLIQLAPEFAQRVKIGGALLLSGILDDQAQEVVAACSPYFTDLTIRSQDAWCSIEGQRNTVAFSFVQR